MRKVLQYLSSYKWKMLGGFIIKVVGTLMDLGLPWVLAYVIKKVIPTKRVDLLFFWGIVMLLLSVGARGFNVLANRRASRVARDVVEEIRHDLYKKIQHLSGNQVDYFSIPSLISRLTSDTYNIHSMIGIMQRLGVRAPIIVVGCIFVTFTLDSVLSLVLIGILPLLIMVVVFVSRTGIPMYHTVQRYVDRMVRVVRENISGIRVIKALSKTEYEKQRFGQVNQDLVEKEMRAGKIMALSNPLMNFLLNLGLALVVIIGAIRVNKGLTEQGNIVAFLSYFLMMLQAVMAINRIFIMYSRASASAGRIQEVLDSGNDLNVQIIDKRDPSKRKKNKEASDVHILFQQVSFYYPSGLTLEKADRNEEKESLIDISFYLNEGESLGIIGSTGSGKTTLIQLLMRFYDVSDGCIKIHGKDIRTMSTVELRGRFGVVFQNDVIFSDTLYENISFGRDLTKEQIQRAGRHAFADEFIRDRRDGYQSYASIKGANLSGGQKQRILIARALAGKPEILILDDSSSALDYKTDAKLRKVLREKYQNTTTILIAQRVSSVLHCDHILVLEEGKMIGYGKHEELLKNCRIYEEIYESQMGGGMQ